MRILSNIYLATASTAMDTLFVKKFKQTEKAKVNYTVQFMWLCMFFVFVILDIQNIY